MEHRTLLGAVGEKDAVMAFKAIGVRAVAAQTAEQTDAAIHGLIKAGARVIFVTEAAARLAPEMIARYDGDADISIIPVPGNLGTDGYGLQRLHQNMLKAIGADILHDNNEKEGP